MQASPPLCKFCRKPGHQRTIVECDRFRRFRAQRIERWARRQIDLEAANTDTTNNEFSDLPEA